MFIYIVTDNISVFNSIGSVFVNCVFSILYICIRGQTSIFKYLLKNLHILVFIDILLYCL